MLLSKAESEMTNKNPKAFPTPTTDSNNDVILNIDNALVIRLNDKRYTS